MEGEFWYTVFTPAERGQQHLPTSLTLLCGIVAGISASVTTQPFDVVKTRMQLEPVAYQRFGATLVKTVQAGGVRWLFTGLAPRATRRTLMAAFTWAFYEEVMSGSGGHLCV